MGSANVAASTEPPRPTLTGLTHGCSIRTTKDTSRTAGASSCPVPRTTRRQSQSDVREWGVIIIIVGHNLTRGEGAARPLPIPAVEDEENTGAFRCLGGLG